MPESTRASREAERCLIKRKPCGKSLLPSQSASTKTVSENSSSTTMTRVAPTWARLIDTFDISGHGVCINVRSRHMYVTIERIIWRNVYYTVDTLARVTWQRYLTQCNNNNKVQKIAAIADNLEREPYNLLFLLLTANEACQARCYSLFTEALSRTWSLLSLVCKIETYSDRFDIVSNVRHYFTLEDIVLWRWCVIIDIHRFFIE